HRRACRECADRSDHEAALRPDSRTEKAAFGEAEQGKLAEFKLPQRAQLKLAELEKRDRLAELELAQFAQLKLAQPAQGTLALHPACSRSGGSPARRWPVHVREFGRQTLLRARLFGVAPSRPVRPRWRSHGGEPAVGLSRAQRAVRGARLRKNIHANS